MIKKQGQPPGPRRGNLHRFPYEPRVVGGKLLMPAELQTIHRYVVETPVLEAVTDEIRAGTRGDCLACTDSEGSTKDLSDAVRHRQHPVKLSSSWRRPSAAWQCPMTPSASGSCARC